MFNLLKKLFYKKTNLLSKFPSPAVIISNEGNILFANKFAEKLLEKGNLFENLITEFLDIPLEALTCKEEMGDLTNPVKLIDKDKYLIITTNEISKNKKYILSLKDVTKQHVVVTDMINTKAQEKEIHDNKNLFLINMANNLKSPIHSIIGFSQAILEGLGGEINDKQEKYLKIIHKNSNELLLLFEKIINLSQIESKLYKYSFKPFDIVNTINTLASEFRPKIEDKNLELIVDTETINKKTCINDEDVIKIVLGNLFENAILSCDTGSITVKASIPDTELIEQRGFIITADKTEEDFILLEITDTGEGIPEAEIQDIFNPYEQADKESKKYVLKSLMLAVTKEFIKQLHGDIWIESKSLEYSTYKIMLPMEKV